MHLLMLTVKRLEKTLPIRLQRRAYVDDNTLALSISYDNLCTTKLSLNTDTGRIWCDPKAEEERRKDV